MEAEGRNCIWYCCPECDTPNTIVVPNPLFQSNGVACKQCKSIVNSNTLHRALAKKFGFPIPADKLVIECTEFTCECGQVNVIFNRVTRVEEGPINEAPTDGAVGYLASIQPPEALHYRIESSEPPKFGTCEDCGTGYDLVYPPSEDMEKWLRSKNYPFGGTDEEKARWADENGTK